MKAFHAVVKTGSFRAAAERLDYSPQLVSKYVNQLEDHLGARLLNRTTRTLSLTEVGEQYYVRVSTVLQDIEDMEDALGDAQTSARGTLRISAPVSFATRHLAPLLAEFQSHHSKVSVDLQLNDRKVDIIEDGFDIALRIGRLKDTSYIAKPLASIRLIICASPRYLKEFGEPASFAALNTHRVLHYSLNDSTSVRTGNQAGQSQFISNNGDVLTKMAIAGAGIAIQPSFICHDAIEKGQLKEILPGEAPESLKLYAVYAHRQWLSSKVRAFLDFADGYFGEPPYWDVPQTPPAKS